MCSIDSAEAGTRKHRKPTVVKVALEPFLVARMVVHKVAQPLVRQASHAAILLAAVPVRAAPQRLRAHDPIARRGELVSEDSARRPRASSANKSARDGEAVRVAYMVSRAPRAEVHRAETTEAGPEPAREESIDRPTVAGSRAILRHGIAYAPANAPQNVKNAIWAANRLQGKPYVWGGGHASFRDRGYDCSGTVSYALGGAGALASPMPSRELMRYGKRGCGRWFTVYARPGHTFAMIAGLRLDTTDFENGGTVGPRWQTDLRETRGYVARHPAGL